MPRERSRTDRSDSHPYSADPAAALPPANPDGRTRRAERTQQAIIDAHVSLLLEGDLRPTGVRIAERAGVSRRALWTHFADREELFAAAGEKTLRLQYADAGPLVTDGTATERVERFSRRRAHMLEAIAGISRAAQLWLPFSAQIRRNRDRHTAHHRAEVEDMFAAELARAGTRRDRLLHALLTASSWPAWSASRDDLGLGAEEAEAVLRDTLAALVRAEAPE